MAYPGDSGLDPKVQHRILTAFGEAARLYREGHAEESRTILRSILEVDPKFGPGQRLEAAIASGSPIDLAQLLGEVTAAAPVDVEGTMAQARQALAQRDFQGALALAQSVLRDLPGHAQARQVVTEAQAKMRVSADVESHLGRARDALSAGAVDEARSFVALARNLDASHPEIVELMRRVDLAARPVVADQEFEFEVFEQLPEVAATTPSPAPTFAPAPQVSPPAVAQPASPPAAAPEPVPAPEANAPAARAVPLAPFGAPASDENAGVFSFDEDGGGAGFEFGAAAPGGDDRESRVQALLDQGQTAFDTGDFQGAIDTWSRIYLIDAHHAEAERRIEQARRRREEAERAAEHKFYEARDAFEQGRTDEARALCREVLQLQPQHLEAHDLLVRLDTPSAPPPPPTPEPPPLAEEDDLFKDDFVPAHLTSSDAVPAIRSEEREAPRARERRARTRHGLPVPLPVLIIAAVALVAIAIGGFLLRGKVFSGGGSATTEALAEADRLAQAGRLQEAVNLLQSLQGQAEGEDANQLNQRVLSYQRQLRARIAATRKTDTTAIRQAIAAGERLKALRMIRAELAKVPSEPELLALQQEITTFSPRLPALADAFASGRWDVARQLAGEIGREHPGDAEAQKAWAIATFNDALVALRQYKVAEAHRLLVELTKVAEDSDAQRLKDLANTYLSKPVDPRYQIFVANWQLRQLE